MNVYLIVGLLEVALYVLLLLRSHCMFGRLVGWWIPPLALGGAVGIAALTRVQTPWFELGCGVWMVAVMVGICVSIHIRNQREVAAVGEMVRAVYRGEVAPPDHWPAYWHQRHADWLAGLPIDEVPVPVVGRDGRVRWEGETRLVRREAVRE